MHIVYLGITDLVYCVCLRQGGGIYELILTDIEMVCMAPDMVCMYGSYHQGRVHGGRVHPQSPGPGQGRHHRALAHS